MNHIAEGSKGNKSFQLLHGDGIYIARFRETTTATRRGGVYYKATEDFFAIVADCAAWLDETPIEDRPTMEPPA